MYPQVWIHHLLQDSFTADTCCACGGASGTSEVVLVVAEPGLVFMAFSSFMLPLPNPSFD